MALNFFFPLAACFPLPTTGACHTLRDIPPRTPFVEMKELLLLIVSARSSCPDGVWDGF